MKAEYLAATKAARLVGMLVVCSVAMSAAD